MIKKVRIAVDHGNRNMKTCSQVFTTGLTIQDKKPARGEKFLFYEGKMCIRDRHGGDDHDYCVLDMHTIFNMTSDYLKAHFKGSTYREGSGSFDHSIVSAMSVSYTHLSARVVRCWVKSCNERNPYPQ